MSRTLRLLAVVAAIVAAMAAMQASALAAPPEGPVGPDNGAFLCPAVGHGVENADANNGDHGVSVIGPIASGDQSFLPGNNQAGANANPSGWNAEGPGSSPGPGDGNSEWSPIWPAP
jgi:ABC-type sugar transport system substrate-binding protein